MKLICDQCENAALWELASSGKWEEAMAETGLGSEMVCAPRLPLHGAERDEILRVIRHAIATRPELRMAVAR